MKNGQVESSYITEAFQLIDSVKNKELSLEDKIQKAIYLSELILLEAQKIQSINLKKDILFLNKLIGTLNGKAFIINLIDQSFRSSNLSRSADQLYYLVFSYGIEPSFPLPIKFKLILLKLFAKSFFQYIIPFIQNTIIKTSAHSLILADKNTFSKYLEKRTLEGFDIDIYHMLKPLFSYQEINSRLRIYLNHLANPKIKALSIQIKDLTAHCDLLQEKSAINEVIESFKILSKVAIKNSKSIFLTIEEYKYLDLTICVFEKMLLDPTFSDLSLGICLQAYLPQSFEYQKKLTLLAQERIKNNGAPIYLRIVKGANLTSEQIEAAKFNWPQPPYITKTETDANFKRMIMYGMQSNRTKAVHLKIATGNVFDIAFALLVKSENNIDEHVEIEMLERKVYENIFSVLKHITKNNFSIHCPIINKKDFCYATPFLISQIENATKSDNFSYLFQNLKPNSKNFDIQASYFKESFELIDSLSSDNRQIQNRNNPILESEFILSFDNDPITDFSIKVNKNWATNIINKYQNYKPDNIPLVIGNTEIENTTLVSGYSPSNPKEILYQYSLANEKEIDQTITIAKENELSLKELSFHQRLKILGKIVQKFQENRELLIGSLMLDIGKNIHEADIEVSEAIDAIEYNKSQIKRNSIVKDIKFNPKGTVLIIPPWGFPCSIATEQIISAFLTGNSVILKPTPETVFVSYQIVKLMYEAGIPKQSLQFVNTTKDLFENVMIKDHRINSVMIATSANNAKHLIKLRNGLNLNAATGGINSIIVSDMADRSLAVKDIITSAFDFSGQKFSSASLLILEKDIYDDNDFKKQLRDAASNLITGSAWDLNTLITPLVNEPDEVLTRALNELDDNEQWLLKPKVDPNNSRLWTPGIKIGVTPKSHIRKQELYGPILSIIKANNLDHAIKIANDSPYGLTAGLHSLDEREHIKWLDKIEVGNCYINCKITDSMIRRQPFGGYKESAFGEEYKAGGPNYLLHFIKPYQADLPREKQPVNEWVNSLTSFLEKIDLSAEELGTWYASVANYSYWYKRFRQDRDPSKILGQDNVLRYVPRKKITLRLDANVFALDALRVCAAALTCNMPLEISWTGDRNLKELSWLDLIPVLNVIEETEDVFLKRLKQGNIKRLRLVTKASEDLRKIAAEGSCFIIDAPVLANGRFELLHYLREVSISYDYHRYGSLELREGELRKPVL